MGIKIHHGPDGTFKTSGAIKDDIIPVIKSGRTLVTNVRGFSRENAVKVLGKKFVHNDFKVIFVDTEIQSGRDKLARFFHWAPKGAFFVIDEVQRIFKPKWKDKDIQLLNYAGGADKALADDRPEDMDTAWDMQRHHNWDFVFTTTSITKVRAEMKDMAKVAIRHYNLGIWRFYKTVEHAADSRGTSKSSQGAVKVFNWVPSKIFKLYSSTKTGSFTNSEPRTPVYRDPKVVGLLVSLALFWGWLFSKPVPKAIGGELKDVVQTDNKSVPESDTSNSQIPVQDNPSQVNRIDNLAVPNQQPTKNSVLEPFLKNTFITGSVHSTKEKHYTFESKYKEQQITFSSLDLQDMGYKIKWVRPCKASITRDSITTYLYCSYNTFVQTSVSTDA